MNTAAMVSIQAANIASQQTLLVRHAPLKISPAFAQWVLALLIGTILAAAYPFFRMNPKAPWSKRSFVMGCFSSAWAFGFVFGTVVYHLVTIAMRGVS